MAEISNWCPYYTDRAVASGPNLMEVIRLVCLFKISLEYIHTDLQDDSNLSLI